MCRARRASTGSVTFASTDGPPVLHLPQRGDAELGGRALTRRAPGGVLAARVLVGGTRVDQQQRDAGGVGIERHRLDAEVAEVDQLRLPRFAEQ